MRSRSRRKTFSSNEGGGTGYVSPSLQRYGATQANDDPLAGARARQYRGSDSAFVDFLGTNNKHCASRLTNGQDFGWESPGKIAALIGWRDDVRGGTTVPPFAFQMRYCGSGQNAAGAKAQSHPGVAPRNSTIRLTTGPMGSIGISASSVL